MKRTVLVLLSLTLVSGLCFAKPKTTVNFWYLWTDKEAARVESIVQQFNASQDAYEVKGLSVPDLQKIKVGIASGDGPDYADDFSDAVAQYAQSGVAEPLQGYITQSKYGTSDFIPAALETCKYQGKLYALPVALNILMLFCNQDIMTAAGIPNGPRTDKELLDFAVKTTKTGSDGSIKVMGFPDFPWVYYVQAMSIALGGSFSAKDGSLTPDSPGIRLALQSIVDYRTRFGVDNVTAFNSSAGYLTAADPFVNGRQTFRLDGPWVGKILREDLGKKDLKYTVVPLPYPAGHPELSGSNLVRSSVFYIPSNAKNKQGAWSFMSWLLEEKQMSAFCANMGALPARLSSLNSPLFKNAYDFKAFADMARSKNLRTFPAIPNQAEYGKIIADAAERAASLAVTPDEALKSATQKTSQLE